MNTLVFDIETVPDVELGRKLHDVPDLDDAAVAKIMQLKQRQARQSEVLPPHQQRVIAISGVMKSREGVRVFSLGDEHPASAISCSASSTVSSATARRSCRGTAPGSICRCSATARCVTA
jgi:hypothetical protein